MKGKKGRALTEGFFALCGKSPQPATLAILASDKKKRKRNAILHLFRTWPKTDIRLPLAIFTKRKKERGSLLLPELILGGASAIKSRARTENLRRRNDRGKGEERRGKKGGGRGIKKSGCPVRR